MSVETIVAQEFEAYLKCGRLEHGFLRVRCETCLDEKLSTHLIRFHGVFAPHSKYRAGVMPAQRGKGRKIKPLDEAQDQTPAKHRASMT